MNEHLMCPCSKLAKAIGDCACDNMSVNSESKAMKFKPLPRNPNGGSKPYPLDRMKLSSKKNLRSKCLIVKTNS